MTDDQQEPEQTRGREMISEVDGYVSSTRAAELLGVSRQRIHELLALGTLQARYWDGRTPMILRESVEGYHESRPPRRGPQPGSGGRPRKEQEEQGEP